MTTELYRPLFVNIKIKYKTVPEWWSVLSWIKEEAKQASVRGSCVLKVELTASDLNILAKEVHANYVPCGVMLSDQYIPVYKAEKVSKITFTEN